MRVNWIIVLLLFTATIFAVLVVQDKKSFFYAVVSGQCDKLSPPAICHQAAVR